MSSPKFTRVPQLQPTVGPQAGRDDKRCPWHSQTPPQSRLLCIRTLNTPEPPEDLDVKERGHSHDDDGSQCRLGDVEEEEGQIVQRQQHQDTCGGGASSGGRYSPGQHPQNNTPHLRHGGAWLSTGQLWTDADLVGTPWSENYRLPSSTISTAGAQGKEGGGSPVTRPPAGVHTPVWAFTAVLEGNKKKPLVHHG